MIKRFIESHLVRLATQYPVVTLTGPRQSGKTTLCKSAFPNLPYANLEDLETRRFAAEDPKGFLARYPEGVVLDEIQRAPDLAETIQGIVDEKNHKASFILTGSQQFEVFNTIRQSLAGRTAVLRLLPFAMGELYPDEIPVSADELIYTGFYPRIHDQRLNPTEALSFYVSTYLERDLQSFSHIRDLGAFEKFLKICASQVGQLVNFSQIGSDCGVDQKTIKAWISILGASYVIFLLLPHHRNFRKRMVKAPKLYFYDVGLACFLLGISSPVHLEHHPQKGSLFENFVVAEFLKNRFNNVRENNLYFFRDHVGNEVDLVLDFGDELVPVEIKSGQTLGSDFLKGVDFYLKLNRGEKGRGFLVYGGEIDQTVRDIGVYSWKNLSGLYERLPDQSASRRPTSPPPGR